MASVKVAVRVRPLNKREMQLASSVIIHMKGNTTYIDKCSPIRGDELKDRGKIFSFDFSYDSTDRRSPAFASQERIFHDLGSDVLRAAFEGFNACVFAYGQTGSGKSYTMMGHKEDVGLIPRICEGLFQEMSQRSKRDAVSCCTEVSYLQIYNERVQDLLKSGGVLRVREHPKDGPYVENLSKHFVHNHSEMENLIILGNANRTTARTGMNDFSSRSHAIFTITFTQAWLDVELPRETVSKIHLVDLAGSERAGATRTTGTRLKEGANINKSLVTLGSVISALADLSVGGPPTKKKKLFIPYRDSVLTWLLKDSLGGNSITTMIATVSPADVNYGESLSTLRYASRAKTIVNSPTVNEVGSIKVIGELQAEVTRLRNLLERASQVSHGRLSSSVKVEQELHQNEVKILALTKEWTSKWEETHRILQEETVALRQAGSGVVLDCGLPHLIGLDEDLLNTGIVLYYLKDGRTLIGSEEASCSQHIVLHGPGLLREHCVLENCAGTVTLIPQDGAQCSVNGSVVTSPLQLTQGAVIKLGRGTILRFNHPTETTWLKEKCQRGLRSGLNHALTEMSTSTENLSKVMLQNPGRDVLATAVQISCHASAATEKLMPAAMPEKHPVSNTTFELDGDALQGGVSTRDGQKQDGDSCHKSGPRLMSEQPWREAWSEAAVASYKREAWSGDANLQQTSVLGLGDGCDTKPEGNANEIQGVAADCYKERPDSGGSSLGTMSHLQSGGGTSPMPIVPWTSTHFQLGNKPLSSQVAPCPLEETAFKGQSRCGEMNDSKALEKVPEACVTETAAASVHSSGQGSLVSKVSWLVQDAGRLLWHSPAVLQQVRKEGLHPVGARLSSHVVCLVRKSSALSIMKESKAFSLVRGSFIFSLLKDSYIFSMVKELPLIQHIQKEINQHLQLEEAANIIQGCINPDATHLPVLTPTQTISKTIILPDDMPLIQESRDLLLQDQVTAEIHAKQEDKLTTGKHQKPQNSQTVQHKEDVQIFKQTLIEFPDLLLNLQTLPLPKMMAALQSVISTSVFTSQKIVALYWLNVAKCGQPEPRPALLMLLETGFYTLTTDSGLLVLFHHLSFLQLKEIQMGLAGHCMRLMGSTEDSILGVYTHSQKITKELCWATLCVICPEDSRVSHHPLIQGDLMKMSLNWQVSVPDLLLDAGLRVCCQFQKSLADLVYFIHCNMDQTGKMVILGEVQILLYISVGVCMSHSGHSKPLAQLFLTDTHLGLLQEDAVFHPTPCCVTTAPCRPQFHDLTLRRRSDICCVLVCDEDERGAVRLDVILVNAKGRGHPESVTKTASPSTHASNACPDAEVWKLTFNCSTEAACLINHLSNV